MTVGLRSFGVGRRMVPELYARWPDVGFHWRLARLAVVRAATHPLAPLPMIECRSHGAPRRHAVAPPDPR